MTTKYNEYKEDSIKLDRITMNFMYHTGTFNFTLPEGLKK